MYSATVHRANVRDHHLVTRWCTQCKREFAAIVRPEGGGAAVAFMRGQPASAARAEASVDAEWHARGLSRIAACPNCRHRDQRTLVGPAVLDALLLFMVLAFFGGIGAALIKGFAFGYAAWIAIGGFLLFVVGVWRGVRKEMRTEREMADRSVLWLFCAACQSAIAREETLRDSWSPCSLCGRAVHELCVPIHTTNHQQGAYR